MRIGNFADAAGRRAMAVIHSDGKTLRRDQLAKAWLLILGNLVVFAISGTGSTAVSPTVIYQLFNDGYIIGIVGGIVNTHELRGNHLARQLRRTVRLHRPLLSYRII